MSIDQAVVAARAEMAPLVADETATISGAKGSYKFKYASLPGILDVVVPALAKHGVLLIQDIASCEDKPRTLCVTTRLVKDGEALSSSALCLDTDGTPKDIAMKATSGRRLQLMAFLGLAANSEEENAAAAPYQRQPPKPFQGRPVDATPGEPGGPWEQQAPLRKAVQQATRLVRRSSDLTALMERCVIADANSSAAMPTQPSEGKQVSMYHYLRNMIDEEAQSNIHGVVLSYLLARVVAVNTPPPAAMEFLIHELRAGKHKAAIAEAYKLATGEEP